MLYNVDIIFTKKIWSEYKNVILLPTFICGNHIINMTSLEKKFNTTIRLTADVKQHLDEMKGSVSASEFIETMLSYFERNGVDPRTSINGKFKTLELQGIERII